MYRPWKLHHAPSGSALRRFVICYMKGGADVAGTLHPLLDVDNAAITWRSPDSALHSRESTFRTLTVCLLRHASLDTCLSAAGSRAVHLEAIGYHDAAGPAVYSEPSKKLRKHRWRWRQNMAHRVA